jgi:hypothetical protein
MKRRHLPLPHKRRGPLPPFWIGFFSIFDITGQWTLRELGIHPRKGGAK